MSRILRQLPILPLGLVALLLCISSAYPLEYSTYLGGSAWDQAYGVAIDHDGNVIVVGWTEGPNFPTTVGAYDDSHNGDKDVFVMVLSADLGTLISSTLIGGSANDNPYDIAVDRSGYLV